MAEIGTYLKKHTEALVKDVGIEAACQITGKSKATLGRYYSDNAEHADRFMPVDAVAKLEAAASFSACDLGAGGSEEHHTVPQRQRQSAEENRAQRRGEFGRDRAEPAVSPS